MQSPGRYRSLRASRSLATVMEWCPTVLPRFRQVFAREPGTSLVMDAGSDSLRASAVPCRGGDRLWRRGGVAARISVGELYEQEPDVEQHGRDMGSGQIKQLNQPAHGRGEQSL